MGYYYIDGASRADLIRTLIASEMNEKTGWAKRCLKHTTAGNVLWTVWEITAAADGSKHLSIGCDLLVRDADGWGYKPSTEDCGPLYYTCPLSYLEMVPEVNPEWRQQVRKYWEKRRARRAEQALRRREGPRHG